MSKLRILFAIPCLALSMALVGCGEPESTFTPIETTEPDGTDADYESGTPPGAGGGGEAAPAGGEAAPAGDS